MENLNSLTEQWPYSQHDHDWQQQKIFKLKICKTNSNNLLVDISQTLIDNKYVNDMLKLS